MRGFVAAGVYVLVVSCAGLGQNCCAPSVPQQGVLGETAALPQTLEVGLHYQYLRSRGFYEGSEGVDNPDNRETDWHQAVLTLAYGIRNGLSVSGIVPYAWKHRTKRADDFSWKIDQRSDGIGDVTLLLRFSPITRSFVDFRELSFGLGVKLPTGSTSCRDEYGLLLIEELQPGTGSWDFQASISYYQGYELVDFIVSGTYILTSEHDQSVLGNTVSYEFGDQFSYLLASNFHVAGGIDLSAAFSGIVRARDRDMGEEVFATGRHQLWFIPGIKAQVIPYTLGLQLYYEHPIYQHFNGSQLGSDYNVRFSAVLTVPLGGSSEGDE